VKKMKEDITGMIFGKWLIIDQLKINNRMYYNCECQCENKTLKSLRLDAVKTNKNLDCGCSKRSDKSLVGSLFGYWKVLELAERKKDTHLKQWSCICTLCNTKIKKIPETYLLRGTTKSCGCNRNKNRLKDITGKGFGSLLVVKRIGISCNTPTWLCRCDCGGDKIIPRNDLKRKDGKEITHCGCRNKESVNDFTICGDYVIGNTTRGWEFYFDLSDLEEVKKYSWCMDDKGYVRSRSIGENEERKAITLHRLLLNAGDGEVVDHKNTTPCDNRRANLRLSTTKENNRNRTPRNKTLNISGIRQTESGMWDVGIYVEGKNIRLGTHETFDQAFIVRKEAEIKYFGEFRYKGNEENYNV
jgi:hypothetical protein